MYASFLAKTAERNSPEITGGVDIVFCAVAKTSTALVIIIIYYNYNNIIIIIIIIIFIIIFGIYYRSGRRLKQFSKIYIQKPKVQLI